MGFAMLKGWIEQGTPANRIDVVEPNDDLRKRAAGTGAKVHASAGDAERMRWASPQGQTR